MQLSLTATVHRERMLVPRNTHIAVILLTHMCLVSKVLPCLLNAFWTMLYCGTHS